ncbi:MAG TPA: restriction endonuclease [Anaeromyxobacteraceae bacterium]|nr:restriction endonuclease [Anaeromyxobacteraceae bacterium]
MNIVIIAFVATLVGFGLIMLAGAGRHTSPAAAESAGAAELGWVKDGGVERFEKMLVRLFGEMGFTAEPGDRGQGTIDFYATDPTPIRGGRIYVRGVLPATAVPVDADEVLTLIDTARAESVGKAVLVTLGRFSEEARDTAKGNPVDLVDGDALAALVKKHLPQAYATKTV